MNKLIKLERLYKDKHNHYYSKYQCSCGSIFISLETNIIRGATKSCGCLRKKVCSELGKKISFSTHKYSHTPTYKTRSSMIQRCTNPKTIKYHLYGGRGIKVCTSWRYSFENFLADMGEKPIKGWHIDRINPDGDYEPNNCRWLSPQENSSLGGKRGGRPKTDRKNYE